MINKKTLIWIGIIAIIVCLAYEIGKEEGSAISPLAKPESGTILAGREYLLESEITVTADSSYDYVVSLKDRNGTEYVSFFVRAGDTVTVGVPSKQLYVFFASGKKWYGYGKGLMFGKDTDYSKDDTACDFRSGSWSYKLYPVTDGNFSESPSNENEFFS